MKYVKVDRATRAVTWDVYFEYLRTVENSFPDSLRSYATDWGHYSLEGENSLHDAWLLGIQIAHNEKELTLEFLGPRHDRRHVLRYIDVKEYCLDFRVQFRHGDRDVFAHEFRLEESLVTHEVLFANFGRIAITARTIMPEVEKRIGE